jgi:hypothetical protein
VTHPGSNPVCKPSSSLIHLAVDHVVKQDVLTRRAGINESITAAYSTVGHSKNRLGIENFKNDHRLGTVGIFTYYKNNLDRILNNITSHGNIK